MSRVILTLNAGSSSLKFAAFDATAALGLLASGQIEGLGAKPTFHVKTAGGEESQFPLEPADAHADHHGAMSAILVWLAKAGLDRAVAAVGHRIVHGGPDYAKPMLLDADSLGKLRLLIPLAPLHQPHNIAGVEAALKAFPSTPQVACFDTAFHRSHPFVADSYALPARSTMRASDATASMASPTNIFRAG